MENSSSNIPKVKMQIFINDSQYLNKTIEYSDITPNYYSYKFNMNDDVYKVKVVVADSIERRDTLYFNKTTYFYVTYENYYDSIFSKTTKEEVYLKKTTVLPKHQ